MYSQVQFDVTVLHELDTELGSSETKTTPVTDKSGGY